MLVCSRCIVDIGVVGFHVILVVGFLVVLVVGSHVLVAVGFHVVLVVGSAQDRNDLLFAEVLLGLVN